MVSSAKKTAARKAMDQAARKGADPGRLKELAREASEDRGDGPARCGGTSSTT